MSFLGLGPLNIIIRKRPLKFVIVVENTQDHLHFIIMSLIFDWTLHQYKVSTGIVHLPIQ